MMTTDAITRDRTDAHGKPRQHPTVSPDQAPPRSRLPLHPFLFAAAPVIALYAGNRRETPFADVLLPLAVVLGVAASLMLAFRLMLRTERAALATSVIIVPFLFSSLLFQSVQDVYLALGGEWLRYRYFLAGWGLVTIGCMIWIALTRVELRKLTGALNLFSGLFLLMSLGSIVTSAVTHRSAAASNDASPPMAASDVVLHPPETKRDIYFLVFDRYADNETLLNDFGYDNSVFHEQLRARGFHVSDHSRANYPSTGLSMASCLNMTYHGEWLGHTDDAGLISRHLVGRLLKQQGYRYYHLGNLLNALRFNELADVNFRVSPLPSEFAETLYQTTPLEVLLPARGTPGQVRKQFDLVEAAATEVEPTFVYSHFLLPHPPYIFDSDGSELSYVEHVSRGERENYINQLIFTNHRILQAVDNILAESSTPPVIILQADEGPWLMADDTQKSVEAKIRQRSGILMALHLPDRDADTIVPPHMTPVNTFRLVFREYFDAKLELLEDRTFYWEHPTAWGGPDYSQPNRFIDVTDRLRRDEPSPNR